MKLSHLFKLLVAIISLYMLACAWFSWSTKREWAKTKAELETRGEKLSLVELLPPPIPDEQNFFASPLFREVIVSSPGTRQESRRFPLIEAMDVKQSATAEATLAAFDTRRDLWEMLYKATDKPNAYFPFTYQNYSTAISYGMEIWKLMQLLSMRVSADIELHKSKEAERDILLIFRLSDFLSAQPWLVSHMMRTASLFIVIPKIREGLERHLWTDEELKGIEARLASENLLKVLAVTLRGERGFRNQGIDLLIRDIKSWQKTVQGSQLLPNEGVARREMISSTRSSQEIIDKLETETGGINGKNILFPKRRVWPADPKKLSLSERIQLLIYGDAFPSAPLENIVVASLRGQAWIDMARIACALERYKIVKRSYPESLDQLRPAEIGKLPKDVTSGKSYHYRRNASGSFTLWSVGFDGIDNNGERVIGRGEIFEKK